MTLAFGGQGLFKRRAPPQKSGRSIGALFRYSILFAAAFVTGLAGFAFGMVAAGIWLFALTPVQTTTLILAYALLVQGYSTWRSRRAILPSRLWPFVVGSAVGIPAGIVILELASGSASDTSFTCCCRT
jgi:uncharacterized membrane protein YfcA